MRFCSILFLVCLLPAMVTRAQNARSGAEDNTAVVVLAKDELKPAAIDVDAKNVYWIAAARTAINKVSKAGGGISAVITDQTGIRRMLVDQNFIYFLTDKQIRRVSTTGGNAVTLVTFADLGDSESSYYYLALDKSNVYFVAGVAGKQQIMRVDKRGGKPAALAAVNFPSGLASDNVNLYWTDYLDDTVKSVSIAGGPPVTVGECVQPGSDGLALDSTSVYCGDSNGKVSRFAKNSGAVTTIGNVENTPFDRVAVDEQSVYALSVIRGIYRMDKRGGTPTRLVPFERTPANFAIDDQYLYWSNYIEGTVSRRRK